MKSETRSPPDCRSMTRVTARPAAWMRRHAQVRRSSGSAAAGWSIQSHSTDSDRDTRSIPQEAVAIFRLLHAIFQREAVVFAAPSVREPGLVEDAVDVRPHPRGKVAAELLVHAGSLDRG